MRIIIIFHRTIDTQYTDTEIMSSVIYGGSGSIRDIQLDFADESAIGQKKTFAIVPSAGFGTAFEPFLTLQSTKSDS